MSNNYPDIDEFHFGAVSGDTVHKILEKCLKGKIKHLVNEQSVCWQADLETHEIGLEAYLDSLSSNSRGQIRRSLRLYESQAPVKLTEASNIEEALSYFETMKSLHTMRWQSKGEQGSFANPLWEKFHRALIQKRFHTGEIQLLKISNSEDIAYLYNFVWRKQVYVLQMGFNYLDDKRIKPGYVAHALAIVHNREKGMSVYDFMHGETRYKRSLSNKSMKLYWVVLQRQRLKFTVEKFAVDVVRSVRKEAGKER